MADQDTNTTQNTDTDNNAELANEAVVEENQSSDVDFTTNSEKAAVANSDQKFPEFRAGDTVRVLYKIIEGDKMRTQPYEGIVIARKGSQETKTFTVRKIGADGIGVERIFPLFSPNIDSIKVIKHGKVRRSKLYYLRDKKGREAMRIKEVKSSK